MAAAIRDILLYDMNLPRNYIASHFMVNTINTYLNDLKWTPAETIMAGIGQSITQVTPIAVARYTAAIANGGTVYDPLIASLAIDCGVKVTILGADTRTIDGKAFGTMLLLLPDDPNEAAKALSYIRSQPNITAEEVEYHA